MIDYGKVITLYEWAKSLGLAVIWHSVEWAVIPIDKIPDEDDAVDLTTIIAKGDTLDSLKSFLEGVWYGMTHPPIDAFKENK